MNVRELKEIIKDLPDDMDVVVKIYDYDNCCGMFNQVDVDEANVVKVSKEDGYADWYDKEVLELY